MIVRGFNRSKAKEKRTRTLASLAADEVADEMRATGSDRFFIVDDNIVSQPQRARELCRALIPLKIHWVGQASIHIAQDDELLELMVASGCRGVLIGMESLDPADEPVSV